LRRTEAARLRWADVSLEGRYFVVYDTKNADPQELPLSDYLLDLLETRKAQGGESPFVFGVELPPADSTRRRGDGTITEPRRWMRQVTARSGVEFTCHDLRRTFITVAESLDVPPYALKRLLNHRAPASDVTGGYIVIDTERLRGPMQRITDYMLRAAGLRQTADVVTLAPVSAQSPKV